MGLACGSESQRPRTGAHASLIWEGLNPSRWIGLSQRHPSRARHDPLSTKGDADNLSTTDRKMRRLDSVQRPTRPARLGIPDNDNFRSEQSLHERRVLLLGEPPVFHSPCTQCVLMQVWKLW